MATIDSGDRDAAANAGAASRDATPLASTSASSHPPPPPAPHHHHHPYYVMTDGAGPADAGASGQHEHHQYAYLPQYHGHGQAVHHLQQLHPSQYHSQYHHQQPQTQLGHPYSHQLVHPQPLRFGLFPQNHQTFPVAIGTGAAVSPPQSFPPSGTSAAGFLLNAHHHYPSTYNHPIVFDRASSGSLQAGHPAYSSGTVNTGPTIYTSQAQALLNVRQRSGSVLSAVDAPAAGDDARNQVEEPAQRDNELSDEDASVGTTHTRGALKKSAAPTTTATTKKQKQRDDSSAAAPQEQRETYGIVDEESTSLWDLADGPDGYTGKPPYPYLTLIRIALLSSEHKRLTLQELYDALEARYPFFDGEAKGWKNSIRHNLSLNRCFKKEARHVLDPGKGSYWFVDLSEEYSTPRIRIRKATGKKGDADESDSPPPVATSVSTRSKKRKGSPSASNATTSNKAARPADLKLPPANPAFAQRGRMRAISAPSPSTASFFGSQGEMHVSHAAAAGMHGMYHPGIAGVPLIYQPGYPTFMPVGGVPAGLGHHVTSNEWEQDEQPSNSTNAAQQANQDSLHPYRPVPEDDGSVSVIDVDACNDARPATRGSGHAGTDEVGQTVVKEEPLEVSIPPLVPDSGTMPDTGSTLATPRSIFSKMLEKSTAAAALANVAAGGVITSLSSPPPGPVASYSFPHSGIPASAPSGTRITIPPPGGIGGRPAPLNFLNKDLRRAYSPPGSAMAQSPTRLLPSKDYDTLFSSMPFGMMFGDGPAKRPSRSGSIFGLSARS